MNTRHVLFVTGILAILVVGAAVGFYMRTGHDDEGGGHDPRYQYGMDLTMEVENITNSKCNFTIDISDKQRGYHIKTTSINVDAHSVKRIVIPVDWDGDYQMYAKIVTTRSGGKSVTQTTWLYSNEDKSIHVTPL